MPEGVGYGPQFTASTGLELNVIGDHAYAYSGQFPTQSSDQTRLNFVSGNFLFVGEIRLAGMINTAFASDGRISTMTVKMNGVVVLLSKTAAAEEDQPSSDIAPIIIPPLTNVEVIQDGSDDEAAIYGTISLTGRIYR